MDWKEQHANDAGKAVDHPLVEGAMKEFAFNMGFALEGLPKYGLRKVALYAAQVARAQALGFDIELLRMSAEEATEERLDRARMAVESGVPVFVVITDAPDAGGPATIQEAD